MSFNFVRKTDGDDTVWSSDVNELQEAIEQLDETATEQTDTLSTHTSELADHEGRVTAAEDAISQLQNGPSVTDGFFEWWIHPRLTFLTEPYPRTVGGVVTSTGAIKLFEWNHVTGARTEFVVGQLAVIDDHAPPALWIEPGRRPVLMWAEHNVNQLLNYKIGSATGDLASFVAVPPLTHDAGGHTSYPIIHKITSESDVDQDSFWVFYRHGWGWHCIAFSVNQATGVVTWGANTDLVIGEFNSEPGQVYMSVADAHTGGDQVLRLAIGYNPNVSVDAIWYYEIDVESGAITTPADEGFTANMSGTNLPIDLETAVPMLPDPGGDIQRHMFAVRAGPDIPAIGYAEWSAAAPADCRYTLFELLDEPGHLELNGGSAQVADHAQLDVGNQMTIIVAGKTPAAGPGSGNLCEFARRFDAADIPNSAFRLAVSESKLVQGYLVRGDTSVGVIQTASNPIPFEWGDDLGIRLVINDAANTAVYSYSLDPLADTPTWTSILSTGWSPSSIQDSTTALVVGGLGAFAKLEDVYYFSLVNGAGSTVAAVDWRTEWDAGASTFDDDHGMHWTINSPAVSRKPEITHDLGPAGPIFGYVQTSGYYASLDFPDPSDGRSVVTAARVGNTEEIKLLAVAADGSIVELATLASAPSADGRLVRPVVPKGGGPIRAAWVKIEEYDWYTDFLGDVRTG